MTRKIIVATGAAMLLALASASAMAGQGLFSPSVGGPGGAVSGGGFGGSARGGGGGNFSGGNVGRPGPSNVSRGDGPRGNYDRGPGRGAYNGDYGRRYGHRNRGRYFVGIPYYGYYNSYYDGGGYSDCGYLYRRAVATGSRYWWRRYQACID